MSIGLFQYKDNPTFEAYAGGTFAELLGIVGVYLIFLIALWQIIQKSIMMGSTIADQLPTLFGGSPGNTTETANYIAGPEMNSKIQQVGSNVGSMISSQQDNRVTHVVSDKVVGGTANNQVAPVGSTVSGSAAGGEKRADADVISKPTGKNSSKEGLNTTEANVNYPQSPSNKAEPIQTNKSSTS